MYSRAIKRVIFVVSLSLSFSTHPKGRFSHIKKLVRRVLRAFGASASTTTTTLPLAFGGGGDDGGGDHAFLSSFFFPRPSASKLCARAPLRTPFFFLFFLSSFLFLCHSSFLSSLRTPGESSGTSAISVAETKKRIVEH